MKYKELYDLFKVHVANERKETNIVLRLIIEAQDKRAFLEWGYGSLFDWLVEGLGYSNAAAQRRIEASRLLRAVPEIEEKLESGELSLSVAARAQTIIGAQERATGRRVSVDFKQEAVELVQGKSTDDAARALFELMPESKLEVTRERRVVIDENTTRHSMNFTKEMSGDLKRLKDVLSHKFPNASDAQIVGHALKMLLEKVDPLRRKSKKSAQSKRAERETHAQVEYKPSTSAAEVKREVASTPKAQIKRLTITRAGARCTYQDPHSGKICGSTYQVQIDHILPKAKGGTNEPKNLRLLCRQHNLLMAEKHFGRAKMDRYRN